MVDSSRGYEFKQMVEWNEADVARWMAGRNIHAQTVRCVTLVVSVYVMLSWSPGRYQES